MLQNALLRDFGPLIDNADFTNQNWDERRRNLLSRAVSALIVRDRMNCDNEAAAALVTDGGQDFGVDAIAIVAGPPRLWLIQTKWNDNGRASIGETDVLKVADGLRRIDQQEFSRFNKRFQHHVARIKAVLDEANCRITLVLAMVGDGPLHDNVRHSLDELAAKFNEYSPYLDVEQLFTKDLVELVQRNEAPEPIRLTVPMESWFTLDVPMRAVNGVVPASEVAQWYADHGSQLFGKNIRDSLGVTQVNAEITRSLIEEPNDFWYRNNGIIMLCDQLDLQPKHRSHPHGSAVIAVAGASVINGAQTVSAIAEAVKRGCTDQVDQGLVNVRIIQSSDEQVSTQITKATNTQNHIERRDFVALDRVQLDLREEFALSLGLNYVIRRSEFEPSPESGCTVREAAIALACAHSNPELALRARLNEDALWEDGPTGAYRQLFGEQPSAAQVWRSVWLLRTVRDALHESHGDREGRAAAIAEHGSLIVAHLVFRLHADKIVDDDDTDWPDTIQQARTQVPAALRWLIKAVNERYGPDSIIGTTFVSPDRVRTLVDWSLAALNSGEAAPDLEPRAVSRRPRRRNVVPVLIDATRLKDGTQLVYTPVTKTETDAMAAWLAEDARRARAAWVNNRSKPLVWAVDGMGYSPSGLVMKMWELAAWEKRNVSVQGPLRWSVPNEGTLVDLANAIELDEQLRADDDESPED